MFKILVIIISKCLAFMALAGLLLGAGICLCAEESIDTAGRMAAGGHAHGVSPDHSHQHRDEDEGAPGSSVPQSKDECGCSSAVPDLLPNSDLGGSRVDEVSTLAPEALSDSIANPASLRTLNRPRNDSGPPRPSRLPLYLSIRTLSL